MKTMRKIVPALAMLLVSLVVMSSASFAWFSMNTTVTATGMKVTAKTDNQFLQIVNSTTDFADDQSQITAEATNANKKIKPTAAVKEFTGDEITALTTADSTAASSIKWVETFSSNPATSTKGTNQNYNDVTTAATAAGETNVYTLINEFKVRLHPNAGVSEANNLSVGNVKITAEGDPAKEELLPAVRVLFTCGEAWAIWKNGEVVSCSTTGSIIANPVTTAPTTVKVYIFFDGEDIATTTNNAAAVGTSGYSVEFTLKIP